jgi:MoxR-like ATPase
MIMADKQLPPDVQAADVLAAERLGDAYKTLTRDIATVIVGQEEVIEQILLGLFCQGHCILEGVPGLAKTLMVSSVAKLLSLEFRRIQFTPDLMPADITGTEILEEDVGTGKRTMKFVKGPIFGNLLLADELNRTPPKTQSALLQAMQEYKVTAGGKDYLLAPPFLVLGTMNPIEQEGTYQLPEAQLDRFMFKIFVSYPTFDDEVRMALATTGKRQAELRPVLSREMILELQEVVRKVLVGESVAKFAVSLVRATRPKSEDATDFVRKYVTWGAGPRACQALLLGGKAKALLDGRFNVSIEDIRFVAKPVLRHRVVTSFTAEAEGVTTDELIDRLIEHTFNKMAAASQIRSRR